MANIAAVNTGKLRARIDKNIYGHFTEHLGRCVYQGIWVGKDSAIPNVRGIRSDVVNALRHIKVPLVRWPGGCFADEYHWKDGIGPSSGRKEMINTHWGGVVEDNHFGTHEFFDFCEQVGCEPYVAGNLGSGTVQEMSEWVEYMTFEGKSPMSQLRKENGRDEPWRLRYFGIGNENWNCGGRMTAEHYADQYLNYQTYCRDYGDNTLYRIACGPRGDNYHWTETLMKKAMPFLDGLALHYYTRITDTSVRTKQEDGNIVYTKRKGVPQYSATEFPESEWDDVIRNAWFTEELVSKHSAVMDRYDPEKTVSLVVDEWGTWFSVEPGTNPGFLYQQNTVRDAVVAAMSLNIFNNHCDRVRMTNIAQMVNVLQAIILTEGERMVLTPTYHVFDLFKVHQDAMLLDAALICDDYETAYGAVPKISMSASKAQAGELNFTLCNVDPKNSEDVKLVLDSLSTGCRITGKILAGDEMNSHNTFENPEAVSIKSFGGFSSEGSVINVKMPARSVVLLSIEE